MEAALRVLGDGLSIAALSIICSVSLGAWKRIPAAALVPMLWTTDGRITWRARRALALLLTPVVAILLVFAPTVAGLTRNPGSADVAVILFCLRATLAAALALLHLTHVRRALRSMEDEGLIDR